LQIYQLLLQNLDVAQQKVRMHASSSMMNSMRGPGGMGGNPGGERGGSLEAEDVE